MTCILALVFKHVLRILGVWNVNVGSFKCDHCVIKVPLENLLAVIYVLTMFIFNPCGQMADQSANFNHNILQMVNCTYCVSVYVYI